MALQRLARYAEPVRIAAGVLLLLLAGFWTRFSTVSATALAFAVLPLFPPIGDAIAKKVSHRAAYRLYFLVLFAALIFALFTSPGMAGINGTAVVHGNRVVTARVGDATAIDDVQYVVTHVETLPNVYLPTGDLQPKNGQFLFVEVQLMNLEGEQRIVPAPTFTLENRVGNVFTPDLVAEQALGNTGFRPFSSSELLQYHQPIDRVIVFDVPKDKRGWWLHAKGNWIFTDELVVALQ